ncbi:MAG: cyclic pyranopterin monophosphate synthase MoaC [Xanthomonadales bacterium]|nr:cyclic pyranopterin monophosphate synthase MoaC [Xanthomonadales bacterium]
MTGENTYAMADVSAKPISRRRALAVGRIDLGPEAYARVAAGTLPKGDALSLARFAGILGAKMTPQLIPLCHPISLNRVHLTTRLRESENAVDVYCLAEIAERTGVEMEALCGLQVALLTIWDLAKPIEPALGIGQVRLLYKEGGKSGEWRHPDGLDEFAEGLLDDSE